MSDRRKIAVITGATGELGSVVVKQCLALDYEVVGVVRPGKSKESPGNRLEFIEIDLLVESQCETGMKSLTDRKGNIDYLIMVAGGFAMGDLKETDERLLDKLISLNFNTAYFMVRASMGLMNPGGRMIFVSGKPALVPAIGKGTVAYALSKNMLIDLSELINQEAKKSGIVSSVVVPGTMNTQSNRQSMPDADFNKWVSLERVAKTIGYLCTDAGSEIREGVIKLYGDS